MTALDKSVITRRSAVSPKQSMARAIIRLAVKDLAFGTIPMAESAEKYFKGVGFGVHWRRAAYSQEIADAILEMVLTSKFARQIAAKQILKQLDDI